MSKRMMDVVSLLKYGHILRAGEGQDVVNRASAAVNWGDGLAGRLRSPFSDSHLRTFTKAVGILLPLLQHVPELLRGLGHVPDPLGRRGKKVAQLKIRSSY
jgi:hypothetical protein